MLVAQNFEAAVIEQKSMIGEAEIDQMAGNIDAVPAFAEQQELPAGRVGNLDDQAAVGSQQADARRRDNSPDRRDARARGTS